MTALVLTRDNLRIAKNFLLNDFSHIKSSHLSEALAAAIGFKTNAALQAQLSTASPHDPDVRLLEEDPFYDRLESFDYEVDRNEPIFFVLEDNIGFLDTTPTSSFNIKYSSERTRAWRNLMVTAINAGIEFKLFTVRENDNRWPGYDPKNRNAPGYEYDFSIAGLHAQASVRDIGHGELSICAVVNPTGDFLNAGSIKEFCAGEAHTSGWLERQKGAWLQSAETQFACRRRLQPMLASFEVKPLVTAIAEEYGREGNSTTSLPLERDDVDPYGHLPMYNPEMASQLKALGLA